MIAKIRVNKFFSLNEKNTVTPCHEARCSTALCCVMNPITGSMHQVCALLDSGAYLTMLNRDVAKAVGLTSSKINISIDVAGGGTIKRNEKEVVLQLVSKDK